MQWQRRTQTACSWSITSRPTLVSVKTATWMRPLKAGSSSSGKLLPHPSPVLSFCKDFKFHFSLNPSNWETCASMFGTFEDTLDPAKFKMTYYGAAAYLQTGCECLDISNSSNGWLNTRHAAKRAQCWKGVIISRPWSDDSLYSPSEAPGFGDPDLNSMVWSLWSSEPQLLMLTSGPNCPKDT